MLELGRCEHDDFRFVKISRNQSNNIPHTPFADVCQNVFRVDRRAAVTAAVTCVLSPASAGCDAPRKLIRVILERYDCIHAESLHTLACQGKSQG